MSAVAVVVHERKLAASTADVDLGLASFGWIEWPPEPIRQDVCWRRFQVLEQVWKHEANLLVAEIRCDLLCT